KSYRDNVAGGSVTFVKALQVGLLIALISSVCYVVTWEFVYFKLMPDFWDKYTAYAVAQAKSSGVSPESVQTRLDEMKKFKRLYDNPLYNAAITFIEPLPVALLMSLLSAAILRKSVRQSAGSLQSRT